MYRGKEKKWTALRNRDFVYSVLPQYRARAQPENKIKQKQMNLEQAKKLKQSSSIDMRSKTVKCGKLTRRLSLATKQLSGKTETILSVEENMAPKRHYQHNIRN